MATQNISPEHTIRGNKVIVFKMQKDFDWNLNSE